MIAATWKRKRWSRRSGKMAAVARGMRRQQAVASASNRKIGMNKIFAPRKRQSSDLQMKKSSFQPENSPKRRQNGSARRKQRRRHLEKICNKKSSALLEISKSSIVLQMPKIPRGYRQVASRRQNGQRRHVTTKKQCSRQQSSRGQLRNGRDDETFFDKSSSSYTKKQLPLTTRGLFFFGKCTNLQCSSAPIINGGFLRWVYSTAFFCLGRHQGLSTVRSQRAAFLLQG